MTHNKDNPYLAEIHANLPRVLSLFDVDQTSDSYGLGDRFFWAWGLIDFANGTIQGAAHGLARLWRNGLWPYPTTKAHFMCRIDSIFNASGCLTRKDGSLEEAFPSEGSYCVTALVAFDLLCAIDLLSEDIDKHTYMRWKKIVAPMIEYLIKADETHALISNHLATAVAALLRWHQLNDDKRAEKKALVLLDRILLNQSKEGWFLEYEGADPGYQSLCTYYLADVYHIRNDLELFEPLQRSIRFLCYFAHPDGSFGGLYGSRCTRFYYPTGFLTLAKEIPEAATLAQFMAASIANKTVVTLSAIDEPNLIPMFNSYCWAASSVDNVVLNVEMVLDDLPSLSGVLQQKYFPDAGIFIDCGQCHYSIINVNKGGVVYHFVNKKLVVLNAGVVVRDSRGRLGSTHSWKRREPQFIEAEAVTVKADVYKMPKQLPNPFKFFVLRFLCLTFFRISKVRNMIKQLLVRILITGGNNWPVYNIRQIRLGKDLSIHDNIKKNSQFSVVEEIVEFVPIHMASQGYWQIQDEVQQGHVK